MRKILLCMTAIAMLCPSPFDKAVAAEIELKAVSSLPKNHPLAVMTVEWVKRINEYALGELRVEYLGGPEVISRQKQFQALRTGTVQVAFSEATDYGSILPETAAFTLSRLTPWEERRPGGFYDFMVERHKKINAVYLGRWLHGPYYLWLKDPVKTPKDLKGRKIRTMALYERFMRALETIPMPVALIETQAALERSTVEGTVWTIMGVRQLRWAEVCKSVIDHPFYGQNRTILINLDTWNSFPQSLQEKVRNITAWFEPYMVGYFDRAIATEWEEMKKMGVEKIRFSPSDARSYVDIAYEVEWKALQEKVPDLAPLLRKLAEY
ncbi:MAG: hypothetical protein GTN74_01335 [Proteobacteria bacterium]|nr:hypothetical protein [Pseudomonadota bacterium]NIS67755.1 hypothetical protein [Pseudomonadota bacterium]